MEAILPAEFTKWAEPFAIGISIIVAYVLKPWFTSSEPATERRVLALPFIIGLGVAALIEYGTPDFNLDVFQRRALATSCGAALLFPLADGLIQRGRDAYARAIGLPPSTPPTAPTTGG